MERQAIKKVSSIPAKKHSIPERQKYRRHLWNMLFVEILLQKLQEKEQFDAQKMEYVDNTFAGTEKKEIVMELHVANEESGLCAARSRQMGRDSLELSLYCFEQWLCCNTYDCVAQAVFRTSKIAENRLIGEAGAVLKEYYSGSMDEAMLMAIYQQYCLTLIAEKQGDGMKEVYECFARANAKCAAQKNRLEGKRFVEESGLSWAGTTYYHALYYYMAKQIQEKLLEVVNETGMEAKLPPLQGDVLDAQNRFVQIGGITFHSVFTWLQYQDNFPLGQYGLRDNKKIPPKNFLYVYRNGYGKNEKNGVLRLKKNIKKMLQKTGAENEICRIACIQGGNAYHNGSSYLLKQKKKGNDNEKMVDAKINFVSNFRLYRICGCMELVFAWK